MCSLPSPCSRFGDGYTVVLRLADGKQAPDQSLVDGYLHSAFPSIELKERHQNVLQYQLPSHACCLSRLFQVLSSHYEELGVADFSVSQTTLDQVGTRPQPLGGVDWLIGRLIDGLMD